MTPHTAHTTLHVRKHQPTCTYMFVDTHYQTHMGTHTSPTSGHTQVDGHTRGKTQEDGYMFGSTHITHKRVHTSGGTHIATHTWHTRELTHCTHSSFRSIGFKAGALYSVGTVCVRLSQFSKFITQIVHDTPCFITLLLQIKKKIWKVRSYLIYFRVIRKMVTLFFQTPELK
jgi:hypothetical protein